MDGKKITRIEIYLPTGEPADGALLLINGVVDREISRRFAPILVYLAQMQQKGGDHMPADFTGLCKNEKIAKAVFKATSTICHDMMELRRELEDIKTDDVPLLQSLRNFGSRLTQPVSVTGPDDQPSPGATPQRPQ